MITEKNQLYSALFNNAAIGIIIVNEQGEMVLVNEYARKQFSYSEGEMVGRKIEMLIPSRYQHKHVSHRQTYQHKNPYSRPMGLGMDLYGITKEGREFPVEVSLSAYETEDGRFAIAFINDISIRKKAEQELVKLNEELEKKVVQRTQSLSDALEKEKELNELKSRFVSMASHEFRTPLSTILSSAYLIAKYPAAEDQPKRDKHIQRIVSSVNTLSDILNDFLSVGRIEEGKILIRFGEVDVPDYIRALIQEMQPILKPGQFISYGHAGETDYTLDQTLLKHIVMNLLSNAIKFSPEQKEIQINTEIADGLLTLSVKDEGIGIRPEDQHHLFERFFRGENVTHIQGTGLGLHIVAKYAELMQGTVYCLSAPGKGTTFTIVFKK